jgi:hypothetical protein
MFPSSSFGFNHHQTNNDGTMMNSSSNSMENHFPSIIMMEEQNYQQEREFSRKFINYGIAIPLMFTFCLQIRSFFFKRSDRKYFKPGQIILQTKNLFCPFYDHENQSYITIPWN